MRRAIVFGVELLLVLLGTVAAFVLRENFEISLEKVSAFFPYLVSTLLITLFVVPAWGMNRSIWRFSSMRDYLHLIGATAVIVVGAVLLSFTVNRMEGVARSIPLLQGLSVLSLLVGARVFMRLRHAERPSRMAQFSGGSGTPLVKSSILIVGVNRLTELFLQSAQEMCPGELHVAGLVGHSDRYTGRLMHRHEILGPPEQIPEILKMLHVHGIYVDRIVVTARFDKLSPQGQTALRALEASPDVRVEFLARSLGLEPKDPSGTAPQMGEETLSLFDEKPTVLLTISPEEQEILKANSYWRLKRAMDVFGSLMVIIVLVPVLVVVALLVLFDVRRPVIFWQQRPGLGGRPFKVYKLRTMAAAHDAEGRSVPDDKRVSSIGRVLRRTRLDELPQLFNILVGEMSFVGPRPLLPIDQPVGHEARLLVRPGLTGWAQVKGGRHLSALDKAALDVWYVRNASFTVDLEVVLRTVLIVIFGEKENTEAVNRAWDDTENRFLSERMAGQPQVGDRHAA